MKPTLLFCVVVFLQIMFHPTAGNGQWTHVPNPIGVYCLASNGSDVFAGTFDSSGVWISTDNGVSWTPRGDSNFVGVYSLAFMGTNWFVGTYEKGVWRSTDLGKSWQPANAGIAGQDVYGMAAIGTNLVAIGLGGIFHSSDSGASWISTSDKYAFESSATPLAIGGAYLYAATLSGLLRSADSGVTWTTLLDSAYLAVAADDANVYASNDSGFIRSTNNGTTWTTPSNKIFGLIYVNGNNLFGGPSRANDITCFVSSDNGATWTDLNQSSRSTSLVVSGPNLIKGTNNTGLWYRPLSGIFAGVKDPNSQDQIISLFPNPTTGNITVQNETTNLLHVTISNLLGETVLDLPHPNSPEFTLDLSKLQPGTYIARFAFANEVITWKIIKE